MLIELFFQFFIYSIVFLVLLVIDEPETSIAVFHGDPNPKHCSDPWCKENWK